MPALLRSELIKLTTTRTAYGLLVGAVAVVALATFSTITSIEPPRLRGPVHTQPFFLLASINLALFTLVLGIRSFTDEFRNGTVISTVLASPGRWRVLAAKAIGSAGVAAVVAAAAEAVMVGLAVLLSSARGGSLVVTASDWVAMAGLLAATAAWAVIGVGVGAVVRHQVAAVVGGLIWILVVENLGAALLGDAGRFLPGHAAHALADVTELDALLPTPTAAALLAGYVAIVLASATAAVVHRDV